MLLAIIRNFLKIKTKILNLCPSANSMTGLRSLMSEGEGLAKLRKDTFDYKLPSKWQKNEADSRLFKKNYPSHGK